MLTVEYKGAKYDRFNSIRVLSSLDNICGQFSFKTTLNLDIPFGRGSFIRIYADDRIILSGFIEKQSGNITKTSQDIEFSGRDFLGDLVDSAVPADISSIEGSIGLEELGNKVINGLKIKSSVRNLAGTIKPFSEEEITAIGYGGKAGSFLQKFARKRQIFLTTYGNGHLIYFRPPTSLGYSDKLTVDSMLSRSFTYDDTGRFAEIEVSTEDNFSSSVVEQLQNPIEEGVERKATSKDSNVRPTRFLQIQAEEYMNDEELKNRADEEINIRRARAFTYTCTVPSHKYSIGRLIKVEDELSGVTGVFLIRSVEYLSDMNGNVSRLTLTFPEAYSGTGKRTTEKKSKIGESSLAIGLFGRDFEEPILL